LSQRAPLCALLWNFGGAGKAAGGGGGWVPRSAGWKLVEKWDFDGLKEEIRGRRLASKWKGHGGSCSLFSFVKLSLGQIIPQGQI
jgi:hypothetical protein